MRIEGVVGPQTYQDGSVASPRLSKTGELIASHVHGRFFENTYRGNHYTAGIANTTLVTQNAIATGLTATAQPIIALWNQANSGVNLVVLQASIINTSLVLNAVNPGGFMWVGSAGNYALNSNGLLPVNCRTLQSPGGSVTRVFLVSQALTGLTNNLVAIRGSSINVINAAGVSPAVSVIQTNTTDNIDGSFIVPQGGVLGLMNQVSTITISVSCSILWGEVLA